MGHKALELTNRRSGRLVALSYSRTDSRGCRWWLCLCDCGKNVEIRAHAFNGRASTKSCGCLKAEQSSHTMRTTMALQKREKHGLHKSSEYKAYLNARTRCENPRHGSYKDYGARGIKFCFVSFEQWFCELGPKPGRAHTVGRIDNDGYYEPGNVKWQTRLEQARNKRPHKPSMNRRQAAKVAELLHQIEALLCDRELCGHFLAEEIRACVARAFEVLK